MDNRNNSLLNTIGGCIVIYALFYIVGICIMYAIILICLLVKLIIKGVRTAYTKTKSWITSRKDMRYGHIRK